MATKEDLKSLFEEVKGKAPWKVLALFITTSVVIGGAALTIMWTMFQANHKEITEIREVTTVSAANQKILMKAFHLEHFDKVEDVKNGEPKEGGKEK